MGCGGVRGVLIKGRRVTWACAPVVGRPTRSGPGISASVARGRRSWRAGPTGQRREERGDARAVSEGWLSCGPRWQGARAGARAERGIARSGRGPCAQLGQRGGRATRDSGRCWSRPCGAGKRAGAREGVGRCGLGRGRGLDWAAGFSWVGSGLGLVEFPLSLFLFLFLSKSNPNSNSRQMNSN